MITVKKWIKLLKHIEQKRSTFYDNNFPGNCGLIHENGVLSFDCIGLVKSVINDPTIAVRTEPVGFYVKPGQVIPDTTELGILELCTDQVWGNFTKMTPGEYLYMQGHGGVYVGDYVDGSGVVNTIECTGAFGGGVVSSYTDKYGRRFDHKGGSQVMAWEAHGKLSRYIDYTAKSEEEEPKKEEESMFKDVPKTDKYYPIYKAMVKAGIMNIDKNGNFNPDKTIKKKHLAIVLYRFYKFLKKA